MGQQAGFRSTADWLTKTTQIGHAGAMVATARALRDHLHTTATALQTGRISEEHVRVIRRAHRIFGNDFAGIETHVVHAATTCTPTELRTFVDRIIQQYRPEDFDRDTTDARAKRKVFLSRGVDGWWHLTGLLDPATGEKLHTALDAYADKTSPDDHRTPAARRADALAEIADRATTSIDRVSGHGHLTLTMTHEQFTTGLAATWPSGTLLTRTDVDQHTCDTDLTVVIHDNNFQPLHLGHTARYATHAQRQALATRDGHTCIHPGCTTTATRCIAHHITAWKHAGPTDLPNLVLICRYHHEQVHTGRLHIILESGRYTTTRKQPA